MNYVFIKCDPKYPASYRVDAWNNPTFTQAVGWNTPKSYRGVTALVRDEYNTHLTVL